MILIFFLTLQPRNSTGFYSFKWEDSLIIGNIYISGKTILSQKEIERILPEPGTPFSKKILEERINRILKFYANNGFPFAEVSPGSFHVDSAKVSCELYINPGHIQRINKVILEGNSFTSDKLLLRHLPIENGTVFNEAYLEKSIKELEKLDYIKVDSFQVIKDEEVGWVSMLLYINEGDRGNLIGAISYSENGGWSGKVLAINKNLFGGGRSVELKWFKEGNVYQNGIFKYMEPYILSLPISLIMDIQHTYIKEVSNVTSISTGIIYSMRYFSLSIIPGIENYARSLEGSTSYPFLQMSFLYKVNPIEFFYRNKWRRKRGWVMEVSSILSFLYFNVEFEYFILSSEQRELLFFKNIRGYPGMAASEGLRIGVELVGRLGEMTLYPLMDASWVKNKWIYSYGIGIKVNKISIEYAIPFEESPVNGRVYISFNE